MTNSDETIYAVINEYDARDPTVTLAPTVNQSSASNQPTKSSQLNHNCDSLRNFNVDDDVVIKDWPEEISDRRVSGLSIDGSNIKCDFCNTGRSLGMINMRHP